MVAVSSVGHVNGGVLFAVEAARRWAGDGIAVNALNPGRITGTALSRHMDGGVRTAPARFEPHSTDVSWKTVEQGAATSVLLAASPLVEGVTGRYFEDCQEAGPHRPGIRRGVAAHALDPGAAARLWQLSTRLTARRTGLPGQACVTHRRLRRTAWRMAENQGTPVPPHGCPNAWICRSGGALCILGEAPVAAGVRVGRGSPLAGRSDQSPGR